ncbi:MAG: C4-type zinc ribbon domain-containing protein [Bacteroidales bacterium]|jgi:predicted  nucleic acid-binding Zn-ribbon protein
MAKKEKQGEATELTVEEKLIALYKLQTVDSEIDKIRLLRGELPLEVQDLEDEVAGLETRLKKYQAEIKELEDNVKKKKNEIKEAQSLIKKYTEQQNNVRNNREFDSLSKEIEYQTLEIELCEKRIREFTDEIKTKTEAIEIFANEMEERKMDLQSKQKELENITAETSMDEQQMQAKHDEIEQLIEDRLRNAYKKIRSNARNGLAVVPVERDACGGCFNKIPPQRQLDVRSRKKIIVCEYCGRILVDPDMQEEFNNEI